MRRTSRKIPDQCRDSFQKSLASIQFPDRSHRYRSATLKDNVPHRQAVTGWLDGKLPIGRGLQGGDLRSAPVRESPEGGATSSLETGPVMGCASLLFSFHVSWWEATFHNSRRGLPNRSRQNVHYRKLAEAYPTAPRIEPNHTYFSPEGVPTGMRSLEYHFYCDLRKGGTHLDMHHHRSLAREK